MMKITKLEQLGKDLEQNLDKLDKNASELAKNIISLREQIKKTTQILLDKPETIDDMFHQDF